MTSLITALRGASTSLLFEFALKVCLTAASDDRKVMS